jgi:hypothetical protein
MAHELIGGVKTRAAGVNAQLFELVDKLSLVFLGGLGVLAVKFCFITRSKARITPRLFFRSTTCAQAIAHATMHESPFTHHQSRL